MINRNGNFFFALTRETNERMRSKRTKKKQKIAYGSNKDLPNLRRSDWSMESLTGKRTRLMRWKII